MTQFIFSLARLAGLWYLIIGGCTDREASLAEKSMHPSEFFSQNGGYFQTLPFEDPDACMRRIRQEVPARWYLLGCTGLYYHLPERLGTQTRLAHLSSMERIFPDDSTRVFIQLIRGGLYNEMMRFDSARICLEESYALSLKTHQSESAGDAKRFLARTYLFRGDFAQAIPLLLEALQRYGNTSEFNRYFNIRLDLANAYSQSKDYHQALIWNRRAWAYANSSDYFSGFKDQAAQRIADTYLNLQQADSALLFLQKALDVRAKYHIEYDQATLLHLLGRAHQAKGDCRLALQCFLEAEQINFEKENQRKIKSLERSLGDAYHCLGQLDSAQAYYQRALPTRDTTLLAELHTQLSLVQQQRGDLREALSHALESRRLHDLVFSSEHQQAVRLLNVRYETAQKERQIVEIEKQQKIISLQASLALLLLSLALFLMSWLFIRQRLRHRLLEQAAALLQQEKELIEAREILKQQALERSQADLKVSHQQVQQSSQRLLLKNRLIIDLEMRLSKQNIPLSPAYPTDQETALQPVPARMKILTDEDWRKFQERFAQSFPAYLYHLKIDFPALTSAEIRLFLLIKLGFNNHEISETLGISLESVYKGRFRLRKKLNVLGEDNLDEFIQGYLPIVKPLI